MKTKKRLAADIMKTSPKKVKFLAGALEDIKKAITRADIRGLIAVKRIVKSGANEHSRAGARKNAAQKRKGRQKGAGTKKGKKYASVSGKDRWMAKIRTQRKFLKELKVNGLVVPKTYQDLYRKSSGGYFRNKRHIKLYLTEHKLFEEQSNKVVSPAVKSTEKKK
ncbi:50S ribosomal protein L19e [Candidatus Woesearchaeota archaeon CG10_big_fil_rev_8_21_14_0_10_32_24]|nr:MAG: 50S ribosomal protein L19e [Candidatus Woesearchaeota archaeon CG10_big_fil_rev_8_21_14_0_10_32_24]